MNSITVNLNIVKLQKVKVLDLKLLFFGIISFLSLSLKGQEMGFVNKIEGLQHTGAVHFYLVPGVTEIEIFKRDKTGYNPANQIMRTFLTGADGTVHDSLKLIGTSRGKMRVDVEQEGVYTLFVSMNNDQQMKSTIWGFQTNAAFHMINSGAGHTDRERTEPIVLDGADNVFGIFFRPEKQSFDVSVTGLSERVEHIEMYDGNGKLHQRSLIQDGMAKMAIDTKEDNGIWELRLPEQKGTILIEGITHDWKEESSPLPVWTTKREAYFDVVNYHWLINPRRFARNIKSGDKGVVALTLYNNSDMTMPLEISLANLPGTGSFKLSSDTLAVKSKSTEKIDVYYEFPPQSARGYHNFNVIARDLRTDKQDYSLIELRVDTVEEITLPVQLKLFEHNQFQFAYEPDYPSNNQFYFDIDNRPWMITEEGLKFLNDDRWETIEYSSNEGSVHNYHTSTIGTDKNGYVYAIVDIDGVPHLIRVSSNEREPKLVPLPVGGTYKIETYMGGKASEYPPVVLRYEADRTRRRVARWARKHRLELFITSIEDGKLSISEPLLITDNCVGISDHSGLTNAVAADDKTLHIIWGEVSEKKNESGVPTYTRLYNRDEGVLSDPTLLAYAPPVNDVHNMSTLLTDTEGDKHVIVGAHGRPFQYLLHQTDTGAWAKPVRFTKSGQTYVGAALDSINGIHLFGRTWRKPDMYSDIFDATLSYQYMDKDGKWTSSFFALPPLPGYSIYYHRVTVDRLGHVYLSMDYWSTWTTYRDSYMMPNDINRTKSSRIIFVSENGKDFSVLEKKDLQSGIK